MKPTKTVQRNCIIYDFHQAFLKRENGVLPIAYFENPRRLRRMILEVRQRLHEKNEPKKLSASRWFGCENCKHHWATLRRLSGVHPAFVKCPECGFGDSTILNDSVLYVPGHWTNFAQIYII